MKRYFIVCYNHIYDNGHGSGTIGFWTNGCYLNAYEIIKEIKEGNPDCTGVSITNIIELNENDYNDFIKK